jgi:Uma2 family endonuclease
MMSTSPKRLLTPEEYLAIERDVPTKHEFYRGEMFAMSGVSHEHNLITMNIGASLHAQLKSGPCEVYQSDMRVKITATGLYTYPDVVVTCQQPRFEDKQLDTLLNPQVIVEVISDSTEAYDRGKKFDHYRKLESLRECLLVAQKYASIDHYRCDDHGNWTIALASGLDAEFDLPAIGCRLKLSDVYARVEFPPESEVDRAAGIFTDEESR